MILDKIVFDSPSSIGLKNLKLINKDGVVVAVTEITTVDNTTVNCVLEDGNSFTAVATNSYDNTYGIDNLFKNDTNSYRSSDNGPVTITITFNKLIVLSKITFDQVDTGVTQSEEGFRVTAFSNTTLKTDVNLIKEYTNREVLLKHILIIPVIDGQRYSSFIKSICGIKLKVTPASYAEMGHFTLWKNDKPLAINKDTEILTLPNGDVKFTTTASSIYSSSYEPKLAFVGGSEVSHSYLCWCNSPGGDPNPWWMMTFEKPISSTSIDKITFCCGQGHGSYPGTYELIIITDNNKEQSLGSIYVNGNNGEFIVKI